MEKEPGGPDEDLPPTFREFAAQHPALCDEELGWFYQDIVRKRKEAGESNESNNNL